MIKTYFQSLFSVGNCCDNGISPFWVLFLLLLLSFFVCYILRSWVQLSHNRFFRFLSWFAKHFHFAFRYSGITFYEIKASFFHEAISNACLYINANVSNNNCTAYCMHISIAFWCGIKALVMSNILKIMQEFNTKHTHTTELVAFFPRWWLHLKTFSARFFLPWVINFRLYRMLAYDSSNNSRLHFECSSQTFNETETNFIQMRMSCICIVCIYGLLWVVCRKS